jgi:hypothetical protein
VTEIDIYDEDDWEETVDAWKAEFESMTLAELLASFPDEPPPDEDAL